MRPYASGSRSKANKLLFDDESMTEYTITEVDSNQKPTRFDNSSISKLNPNSSIIISIF